MDQTVVALDPVRIFLGSQEPVFLAEILLRTTIIYTYTFLLVRWVGGRSVAQLSVVEFILVIALGSAVGDPMFYPDVPLLHAMIVITVVVLINKGLDVLILNFAPAQRAIEGLPVAVVTNGRLLLDKAADRNLGRAEICEQLRLAGIRNLGEVEQALLEANGKISVFRFSEARPGLLIIPEAAASSPLMDSANDEIEPSSLCCAECGSSYTPRHARRCIHCGQSRWTTAVKLACQQPHDVVTALGR
jgi:uncharacterized membrane protein YcaP (DUF421 family)